MRKYSKSCGLISFFGPSSLHQKAPNWALELFKLCLFGAPGVIFRLDHDMFTNICIFKLPGANFRLEFRISLEFSKWGRRPRITGFAVIFMCFGKRIFATAVHVCVWQSGEEIADLHVHDKGHEARCAKATSLPQSRSTTIGRSNDNSPTVQHQ